VNIGLCSASFRVQYKLWPVIIEGVDAAASNIEKKGAAPSILTDTPGTKRIMLLPTTSTSPVVALTPGVSLPAWMSTPPRAATNTSPVPIPPTGAVQDVNDAPATPLQIASAVAMRRTSESLAMSRVSADAIWPVAVGVPLPT